MKENHLKQYFPHDIEHLQPTIGLRSPANGSRNKAKFAVFLQNNQITFGFYNSDGSTRALEECPLHAEGINNMLEPIKELCSRYNICPYDIKTQQGELKYLLITGSGAGDEAEFLVRFVLRSTYQLPQLKKLAKDLRAILPRIKVITANLQPIHQAVLEGDEEIVLTEQAVITHQFDEFKLALGARSFFQVTPEIAKALYNAVSEAIAIDAPSSLLDLYCGVGAFSFYASRHCHNVTGIEISKEAIACAKHSTKINDIPIRFIADDVEKYLQNHIETFDAVIVNPPRRGLNTSIIKMIKTIAPQYIYYSSCNAQTMARDYIELQNLYAIKSLRIFDMFPYTSHYETLMCLIRRSA